MSRAFFDSDREPDAENQQELLHLQVAAIFFVTFLIVIALPPFRNGQARRMAFKKSKKPKPRLKIKNLF
jgi:hypothetical protein